MANQLASLADTRLPVGELQYRIAQTAWHAFTSPDPMDIQRFIENDTSGLPFINTALQRHLEQFPAVNGGLSRTEPQALSVLREHESLSGGQLFVAVQRQEEQAFMGEHSFYRLMADLHNARHPLVKISDTAQQGRVDVRITETGRDVIEGRADHIRLNGIDRWLGGVHLKGENVPWRCDRASERIIHR
ncbi:MAG TPA: hypothetical protein VGK48_13680 [Terriglobia bacterium]|jgi:hypothetical protein